MLLDIPASSLAASGAHDALPTSFVLILTDHPEWDRDAIF